MCSFEASIHFTSAPGDSATIRLSEARVSAADDDSFMSCVEVWRARMRRFMPPDVTPLRRPATAAGGRPGSDPARRP